MSVPELERYKGRLTCHVCAADLAAYTTTILSNPKVFNPEINPELIKRIANLAIDIAAQSWAANKINAETSASDRKLRYEMQIGVIEKCNELAMLIGVAKRTYKFRSRKMRTWRDKIVNTRSLLQAWKESDVNRYGYP